MPADAALRAGGRDHGGVGRGAARGVRGVPGAHRGRPAARRRRVRTAAEIVAAVRERVRATGEELGGRLRLLVGKPGLDGHSNGAEQIAVRARDGGFEVVYQGIRLTPGADRRGRRGGGRPRGRAVDPVRLAPRGGAGGAATGCARRAGRRARRRRRHHPGRRRRRAARCGRGAVFTPKDYGLTDILARSSGRAGCQRPARPEAPAAGVPAGQRGRLAATDERAARRTRAATRGARR